MEEHQLHYNADPATAELMLRMLVSVNHLSMKGAFADWYEELAQQISDVSSTGTGIPVAKANDESESKVAPTVVLILAGSLLLNVPARGNSVQQHSEK